MAAALRLFYRLKIRAGTVPDGPVMFVGNHPNAMIDPSLVFALTGRRVTFLAKAPLFSMPMCGTRTTRHIIVAMPKHQRIEFRVIVSDPRRSFA